MNPPPWSILERAIYQGMSMSIPAHLYETDFYNWLSENARLLRSGRLSEIDVLNIAEELESMGKSERRALLSRLTVLLAHLLKWQYQPTRQSRSWRNTILVQRLDINELLQDSPSLTHAIDDRIQAAYQKACLLAEEETGIDKQNFPQSCPYSLEQMLDEAFFPDASAVLGGRNRG